MPKARAYSRYLYRDRHKRRYTLTATKLVVGFLISLMGSVFVGSYFERYGPVIVEQSMTALRAIFMEESEPDTASGAASTPVRPRPTSGTGSADISTLYNRVKNIPVSPQRQEPEVPGEPQPADGE